MLDILSATSFSLMPVTLEFLVDLSHLVALKVINIIALTTNQLLDSYFILVSSALQIGETAHQPNNMKNSLIL